MFSTALAVVSDYVLDFCLKRDFDDSSCSKTNEVFLTMINGSLVPRPSFWWVWREGEGGSGHETMAERCEWCL